MTVFLLFGLKTVTKPVTNRETQSKQVLCVSVPQPNTDSVELTQIEQRCCDFSAQKWAPSANRIAPRCARVTPREHYPRQRLRTLRGPGRLLEEARGLSSQRWSFNLLQFTAQFDFPQLGRKDSLGEQRGAGGRELCDLG